MPSRKNSSLWHVTRRHFAGGQTIIISKDGDAQSVQNFAAKEIIAKSVEMDLETVQKYLKAENELEAPRKTVLEALTARISELENAG